MNNTGLPLQIVNTEDGSRSIFSSSLNETYHSKFGAVAESECVFFKNGLDRILHHSTEIEILEAGFGTGLNAMMSLLRAEKFGVRINYSALDLFWLPIEIANQLNYPTFLKAEKYRAQFETIHNCGFDTSVKISEMFNVRKLNQDIETYISSNRFDIIFYDSFSPEIKPELWTNQVMKNMFDTLKLNGIFTTYCAKGKVKRALSDAGFRVTNEMGPKGKREITVAYKQDV